MPQTILIAMLALMAFPVRPQPAVENPDQKALQGTWVLVSLTSKGQMGLEKFVDLKLRFKGDRLWFLLNGKAVEEVGYLLNPAKNPREIDVINPKNCVLRGIYALQGDDLIVAQEITGKDARPTEFRSGESTVIAVFRRQPR